MNHKICSKCRLKPFKPIDELSTTRHLIKILWMPFECTDCKRISILCRFCGLYDKVNSTVDRWYCGNRGEYYQGPSDQDFFRHLALQHKDLRYLEIKNDLIYFAGYERFISCVEAGRFINNNPHVLFIETEGMNYRERMSMFNEQCIDDLHHKHFVMDELIQPIINGNNTCLYCGYEYETYPPFEIFIQHIDSCMPQFEDFADSRPH